MSDIHPGDGLTIEQLLRALRDRFTVIQNKPVDLTLDEARVYEQGANDILVRARSLVNSLQITLRTPPEVLGMISSYLSLDDLFNASQVCHYWRSVLISIPYLWTRISCEDAPSAIICLERSKSLPIHLQLEPVLSNAVLKDVLLYRNPVASLTLNHMLDDIPHLYQLFVFSSPTVKRLKIYADNLLRSADERQALHEIWQDFPSLRELFVGHFFVPIDRLTAPNLVHLALEYTGHQQDITVQAILDALRGCPLLETLLLHYSDNTESSGPAHDHTSVFLPHLRSIEMGPFEVRSGLISHLDFPLDVAVGFRTLSMEDLCGDLPLAVLASMQHVLSRIEIHCVTLAAPPLYVYPLLLIRFEGPRGSLEITTWAALDRTQRHDVLFGPEGVLFCHSPRIDNVTEIHIVGCSFHGDRGLDHISTAMPNLVSISLFNCNPAPLQLAPKNPSSPPFPRLERVMVLGVESGLEEMTRVLRDLGVPLKTLVVGQGPRGSRYGNEDLKLDYTLLAELVEDLRIRCPTKILDWGTRNEIRDRWTTIRLNGPLLCEDLALAMKFCQFDTTWEDGTIMRDVP